MAGGEVDGGREDFVDLGFRNGFSGEFKCEAKDVTAERLVDVQLVAEGIHSGGEIAGGFGKGFVVRTAEIRGGDNKKLVVI